MRDREPHLDAHPTSHVSQASAEFEPIRRFDPDDNTLLLLHLDGEAVDEFPLGHDVSAIDLVWEPDDGYGRETFCEDGGG